MTLEGHRTDKAGTHKMTHVRPYSPAVGLMRRTSNHVADKVPERRSGHPPVGPVTLNTTRIIVKRIFMNFRTIFLHDMRVCRSDILHDTSWSPYYYNVFA